MHRILGWCQVQSHHTNQRQNRKPQWADNGHPSKDSNIRPKILYIGLWECCLTSMLAIIRSYYMCRKSIQKYEMFLNFQAEQRVPVTCQWAPLKEFQHKAQDSVHRTLGMLSDQHACHNKILVHVQKVNPKVWKCFKISRQNKEFQWSANGHPSKDSNIRPKILCIGLWECCLTNMFAIIRSYYMCRK